MKRLYFFLLFLFSATIASAQPRLNSALLLESQRGEVFQLVISGKPINPVAQSRVSVGDLPTGRHLLDIRVGVGFRMQRIRAEVVLREDMESVFVLVPTRRGRSLVLQKVEELPLNRPLPANPTPDAPGSDICRYIMNEDDVSRTLRFMKEEGFDDRRLEIAKGEIKLAGGILTDDLVLLLKAINFENRRVALAKYAYTYICDNQKFSRVLDAFDLQNSKREIQDFIYSR